MSSLAADWRSDQLADDPSWRLPLSEAHRSDVLAAVAAAQTAGLRLEDVVPQRFPLPTLGPYLKQLAQNISNGRGFGLVKAFRSRG
jgi:hypothetical protein